MDYVTHTLTLKSRAHYGRRVPADALGGLLTDIPAAVEGTIRMAFEGRSAIRGRRPAWLESAADVRFVGHEGRDETILRFEAPRLGDAAPEFYTQRELWPTKPDEKDTGFDLLGDVLIDLKNEDDNSDRFDQALLKKITGFHKSLNGAFQEFSLTGRRSSERRPAKVDHGVIEVARRFRSMTPHPQRVRIVGVLDMIRASTRSFALKLQDGREVRGVWANGEIDAIKDFFHHEVLVHGQSVFRPSGGLLRIDAESVLLADGESEIWSQMPESASADRMNTAELRKPQGPRRGLSAIIGKWPGDESDEEIQEELESIS